MTPEGKVKDKVKRTLKEAGAYFYMPVPCGYGVVGAPDIVACVPVTITKDMVGKTLGVFAGVECKAPTKIRNTTPNQKATLASIMKAGGIAIVADDPSIVKTAIDMIRKGGDAMFYVPV